MAKPESDRPVERSVLDRLLDTEPEKQVERIATRSVTVAELKNALRRDLEWLLNTRRPHEPLPTGLEEVPRSLYYFGLPDFTSMGRDSADTHKRLARLVEETITTFEPRLTGVKVQVQSTDRIQFGELHFIIEGMLQMDPAPEMVSFDTLLQTGSGNVVIEGGGNA